MTEKAIILLSGGLDSATTLAIASTQNFECYALSFNYSQRHKIELLAAKKIAEDFSIMKHKILMFQIYLVRAFRLPMSLPETPFFSPLPLRMQKHWKQIISLLVSMLLIILAIQTAGQNISGHSKKLSIWQRVRVFRETGFRYILPS
jgi:asparagine synthetase B (glutamine-hydrolysing)